MKLLKHIIDLVGVDGYLEAVFCDLVHKVEDGRDWGDGVLRRLRCRRIGYGVQRGTRLL